MKTKIAPIKVGFCLYVGASLTGLGIALMGHFFKNHAVEKIGMTILLCGLAIGLIPFLGACAYLLWKKSKREPQRKNER